MLALAAGDYALTLAPERGGAVLRFDWRGQPLMRPACGPAVLDEDHGPLVPFSIRIGEEGLPADNPEVWLGSDPLPVLDWLGEWSVAATTPSSATLLYGRAADGGHAPYVASQALALDGDGLRMTICVVNMGAETMPVDLGIRALLARGTQAGRQAAMACARPLRMDWLERDLALVLEPSDNLALTGFLAPGEDIRCCAGPMMLAPGGAASASLRLRAAPVSGRG